MKGPADGSEFGLQKGLLTMLVTAYSSGMPNRYEVLGLPAGETADLGSLQRWRIRRNKTRYRGAYKNAEDALAALQAQVDAEVRAIQLRSLYNSHG